MSSVWTGTYRLQMHKEFPLTAAAEILPYLKKLGISHVYLSPCLQAAPGSTHGYDVADPGRINDELGGERGWQQFVARVKFLGLKILLDIVPNHMSATFHNPWWDDVLAHGPYSQFVDTFDLRLTPEAPFKIQVCSLARAYGDALKAGELKIELVDGVPRVTHFDNSWPLTPASWGTLLGVGEFAGCSSVAASRPDEQRRAAYETCKRHAHEQLGAGISSGHVAKSIEQINADPDRLHFILRHQFYALHGWKLSGELGNYRRFFDVDSLIGIRTEAPSVMSASHARIQKMLDAQELDGLRIDHPDGLRDPEDYFRRLRKLLPNGRIYIEKILENEERLVDTWDVDGTVGYDFLSKVNRLWMDDQRIDALTATYFDFTHQTVNLSALVRQKKGEILNSAFSADLARLSDAAISLSRNHWSTNDISPRHMHDALAALTVALPVYRTYRTADRVDERDARLLSEAVQRARTAAPKVDPAAFDFLLELCTKPKLEADEADFIAKWQQLAPAVMAKGVEDTTFYCFDRLLSCNEVGASAALVGISNDKFHEYCHYLSENWPHNQLTTSTHDNKRSEDVRTRISVLSEIPDRWAEALHQWSQLTEPSWNNRTPDRHAEYLLYQTMIGAWPIDKERCWQYMLKASREAKLRTSWHEPNAVYESNIRSFTESVFENAAFLESLNLFIEPLVLPGRINSLAQTLIKMVIPGVPDLYQGNELWDLSLVDPDNRRPVDYENRVKLLERCASMSAEDVLAEWHLGLPKLWLTTRLLHLRRDLAHLFAKDSHYKPMGAQGSRMANLLAFRRGEHLIGVVPRFTLSVGNNWGDTQLPLPQGSWRDVFTGICHQEMAAAGDLFSRFPVALLLQQ